MRSEKLQCLVKVIEAIGLLLLVASFVGLFLAKSLPSGAPATEEQVRMTILEGRGTMPAFDRRLREEDAKDLVKYLHRLK